MAGEIIKRLNACSDSEVSRRRFLSLILGGAAAATLAGCSRNEGVDIAELKKEKLRIELEKFKDILEVSERDSVVFVSINTRDLSNNAKIVRAGQVMDYITRVSKELGYIYKLDIQVPDKNIIATILKARHIEKIGADLKMNTGIRYASYYFGFVATYFTHRSISHFMGVGDIKHKIKCMKGNTRDNDESQAVELKRLRWKLLTGRIVSALPSALTFMGASGFSRLMMRRITAPDIVIKIY